MTTTKDTIMALVRVVQDESRNDGKLGATTESERTTAAIAALMQALGETK